LGKTDQDQNPLPNAHQADRITITSMGQVYTTLCDKVCHRTNRRVVVFFKESCFFHDKTEIFLKVALSIYNPISEHILQTLSYSVFLTLKSEALVHH